jgi:membrane-bound lytic murein transglycosylase D
MNNAQFARLKGNFILHKILPGETISQVAKKYNVPPHLIAAWNDLKNINRIRAGQQLALYISNEYESQTIGSSEPEAGAQEEPGKKRLTILSGPRKKIAAADRSAVIPKHYRVKGGDSLWKIAKQFNINTKDIVRWNNLKDDMIHPGLELVLNI